MSVCVCLRVCVCVCVAGGCAPTQKRAHLASDQTSWVVEARLDLSARKLEDEARELRARTKGAARHWGGR